MGYALEKECWPNRTAANWAPLRSHRADAHEYPWIALSLQCKPLDLPTAWRPCQ